MSEFAETLVPPWSEVDLTGAFPSHGKGRRFNPCSAHHSKRNLKQTKFTGGTLPLSDVEQPFSG